MKLVGIPPQAPARRPALAIVQKVFAPKVGALLIVLALWEGLVVVHWRPVQVLPPPAQVLGALAAQVRSVTFYEAVGITLGRAAVGYSIALLVGTAIGVSITMVPVLRSAVGSLITGLSSMPSIAWFPFAILLFQLSEQAILFVVVLGAAPTIAHGVISGIDNVPRRQVEAARILGARGLYLYRRVILPAAMPQVLIGLKAGWAFAWRSLLAAELLVIVAGRPSLGVRMQSARKVSDAATMLALLVVLLAIGVLVDYGFSHLDRHLRRRRGMLPQAL
ncbi:MAG: ABC transporter permease [Candidatus Dormibacteraeota bacterium]|nr:ABC transporter permease [Candidatus Dormibacteraeota bacterium]